MVASNDAIYRAWIEDFQNVTEAYEKMRKNMTVEQTMRSGVSTLAAIVHAANVESNV